MCFGKKMFDYRRKSINQKKNKHLTQSEVAEAMYRFDKSLNYSDTDISRWETGTRTISYRKRDILMALLYVFFEYKGMQTLGEANAFLQLGGYGSLTNDEQDLFAGFFPQPDDLTPKEDDDVGKPEQKNISVLLTDPHSKTRHYLITAVQHRWIDGLLKSALIRGVVMSLTWASAPELVHHPVSLPTPSMGAWNIRDVFEGYQRKLLIVGAGGSGKTIALVQLVEQLLEDARQDERQPIPVVIPLEGWYPNEQDLLTWLGEMLFLHYKMARPVARQWVVEGKLILLLDGLDELLEAEQSLCVAAINQFQAEYAADIVVSSREDDYCRLPEKLNLVMAVRLLPLNLSQIGQYLQAYEGATHGLRQALVMQPALAELAESPLLLSMLSEAYAQTSPDKILITDGVTSIQEQLLDDYVASVFTRWPMAGELGYGQDEAICWLTFMAERMSRHNTSTFYLETLQPTWLLSDADKRWQKVLEGGVSGIVVGGLFAFFTGVIGLVLGQPMVGLVAAAGVWALLIGVNVLVNWFFWQQINQQVEISETQVWEWPPKRPWQEIGWRFLKLTAVMGLVIGPSLYLFINLGWLEGSGVWWAGIIYTLVSGSILGIVDELWVVESIPEKQLFPNSHLLRPRKNELVRGLFIWASLIWLSWMFGDIRAGLIFGGIAGGAYAFNQPLVNGTVHYTVRWVLAKQQWLPFSFWPGRSGDRPLVAYLDEMSDRWLLHRVGTGWRFRHRYLLDYFASKSSAAGEIELVEGS